LRVLLSGGRVREYTNGSREDLHPSFPAELLLLRYQDKTDGERSRLDRRYNVKHEAMTAERLNVPREDQRLDRLSLHVDEQPHLGWVFSRGGIPSAGAGVFDVGI
jgi:hypothetical protein